MEAGPTKFGPAAAKDRRPVYWFFSGKGGVGKTTCAAAAAVRAADRGEKVLVVSTDPAHSLGDVLGVRLSSKPRTVKLGRRRLQALELDAGRAMQRWLARSRPRLTEILEHGTYFEGADLEGFWDLAIPGADELMGLWELRRVAEASGARLVVVDTAPTGHTLRLLASPASWVRLGGVLDDMQAKHRFLVESLAGGYVPDANDALVDELMNVGQSLQTLLRDADHARYCWVLRPERLALEEAVDGVVALAGAGIQVSDAVVNGRTPRPPTPCRRCDGLRAVESGVEAEIRGRLGRQRLWSLESAIEEPRKPEGLRKLFRTLAPLSARSTRRSGSSARQKRQLQPSAHPVDLRDLLDAPRLLFFGGKGGVGKTTCAAAAALTLAGLRPKRRILLLSVDPAHSLSDVLGEAIGDRDRPLGPSPSTLFARELDADRAFALERARYREAAAAIFEARGPRAGVEAAFDRAIVEELIDLAPPGVDELFAISLVVDSLQSSRRGYDQLVVDMAPTGHGLRLLQTPETARRWVQSLLAVLLRYREVIGLGQLAADLVKLSKDLAQLIKLLRGMHARIVVVTRSAAVPRLETERLLETLSDLRLTTPAVIVNAMVGSEGCTRCRQLARLETKELAELLKRTPALTSGCAIVTAPELIPPPHGAAQLVDWARYWTKVA